MNSSTFLCSLGLLMVAGYASAGGVARSTIKEEKGSGSCPGANKCIICPARNREVICVPPLANDIMIDMYCNMKYKVFCSKSAFENNFPYLDSEENSKSESLPTSKFVNVHEPKDRAMAVVENVQGGTCPFLFFCKSCSNGAKLCCPKDITIQAICCYGVPPSTQQC